MMVCSTGRSLVCCEDNSPPYHRSVRRRSVGLQTPERIERSDRKGRSSFFVSAQLADFVQLGIRKTNRSKSAFSSMAKSSPTGVVLRYLCLPSSFLTPQLPPFRPQWGHSALFWRNIYCSLGVIMGSDAQFHDRLHSLSIRIATLTQQFEEVQLLRDRVRRVIAKAIYASMHRRSCRQRAHSGPLRRNGKRRRR